MQRKTCSGHVINNLLPLANVVSDEQFSFVRKFTNNLNAESVLSVNAACFASVAKIPEDMMKRYSVRSTWEYVTVNCCVLVQRIKKTPTERSAR